MLWCGLEGGGEILRTKALKVLFGTLLALLLFYSLGLYFEVNVDINGKKNSFSFETKQHSFSVETNFDSNALKEGGE